MTDRFEELLRNIDAGEGRWKQAVIDVADTAYLVRAWLKQYGVDHTAKDVVAMTALILDRERSLVCAEHDGAQ